MTTTTGTFSPTRKYARVPCNAAAAWSSDGQSQAGVCENLSIGGAFFRGTVPSMSTVTFTLCLPSVGPVTLTGEVCHRTEEGCGLRFTRMAPQALVALCGYVGAR